MQYPSYSIDRRDRKHRSGFVLGSSSFFNGFTSLSLPKKIVLLGLLLFLVAFFGLWGSNVLSNFYRTENSTEASLQSKTSATKQAQLTASAPISKENNAHDTSSVLSQGSNNGASNQATVSINGQSSISVHTDASKPEATANKNIKTSNGNANVSIHSSVNSSSNQAVSSFQEVQVDSSSNGSSSTQVQVNQSMGGGN